MNDSTFMKVREGIWDGKPEQWWLAVLGNPCEWKQEPKCTNPSTNFMTLPFYPESEAYLTGAVCDSCLSKAKERLPEYKVWSIQAIEKELK